MSWHYSQALEAACSQAGCSVGERSAPSRSTTMPAASSCSGRTTGTLSRSRSGTTCEPSTADRGVDWWTSSLAASRARTLASPGRAMGLRARGRDCGRKCGASFARFDRPSSSWKTHQLSLLGGWEPFSETWPRWGMMRDGECWELDTWERLTGGTGSGSWPTPTAQDAKNSTFPPSQKDRDSIVGHVLRNYPTPTAVDAKRGVETQEARRRRGAHTGTTLNDAVNARGGELNPHLHQWLMGWPLGWTSLSPLETAKFQRWLSLHGACSDQPAMISSESNDQAMPPEE